MSEEKLRALSDKVSDIADQEFLSNAEFRKKLNSDRCREWLAAFFEHVIKSGKLLPQ